MTRCKDCEAEGITSNRPTPHPGPRCTSHHRKVVTERRTASHGKRVQLVYGLLPGEYDLLLAHQGGVCAICKRGFAKKRGSVDHDHKLEHLGMRNAVRGIVHGFCNTMLGRWRDDPEAFERAANYLRNPPAREVLTDEREDGST